jgi:hypothetical protein
MVARAADPPSPEYPADPVPATVLMMLQLLLQLLSVMAPSMAVTLRILWFSVSAI